MIFIRSHPDPAAVEVGVQPADGDVGLQERLALGGQNRIKLVLCVVWISGGFVLPEGISIERVRRQHTGTDVESAGVKVVSPIKSRGGQGIARSVETQRQACG